MKDILNNDSIVSEIRQRKRRSAIKWTLVVLIFLVVAVNMALCLETIPAAATISSPEYLTGARVIYALGLTILFIFPLASFIVSAVISIIPAGKTGYKKRLVFVFLVVVLLVELIALAQLLLDVRNYQNSI